MSLRASRWTRHPYYWWLAISVPAVTYFTHSLAPEQAFFRGQGLAVLTGVASGVAVVGLWFCYRPRESASRLLQCFLILTGLGWLYTILRIQLDDSLFNLAAFLVPVMIVLIWIKPPPATTLLVSLQVIAYSIAIVSGLSLILGITGIGPNGFAVPDAAPCRLWFSCDVIGLIPGAESAQLGVTRWGGPFGSVNIASPAGGLVLIVGLISRGHHRWVLACSGASLLLLGQGRITLVAVTIAVTTLVVFSGNWTSTGKTSFWRICVGAGVVALVAAGILFFDPTINGRLIIWRAYIELWTDHVLFGVGDSGVRNFISSQPGPLIQDHAHSVLLNAGTRYGLVLAILLAALYVIASIAAVRILRRGWGGPLAVLVFIFLAGSAETLYRAEYWTFYLAILITIVAGIPASSMNGLEPQDQGHAFRSGH